MRLLRLLNTQERTAPPNRTFLFIKETLCGSPGRWESVHK